MINCFGNLFSTIMSKKKAKIQHSMKCFLMQSFEFHSFSSASLHLKPSRFSFFFRAELRERESFTFNNGPRSGAKKQPSPFDKHSLLSFYARRFFFALNLNFIHGQRRKLHVQSVCLWCFRLCFAFALVYLHGDYIRLLCCFHNSWSSNTIRDAMNRHGQDMENWWSLIGPSCKK